MKRKNPPVGVGHSALAQSLRAAFLGGGAALLVSEAAARANLVPGIIECSRLRQAGLLGGVSLSWSIGQQGGVTWYATDTRRHVPQRVGSLAELLLFLEALAGRLAGPESGPLYYFHGRPRSPLRRKGRLSKRVDKPAGRR